MYLLSRSTQNKKLVFAPRSLAYVLLEKQVVDLDIIKTCSLLQHRTRAAGVQLEVLLASSFNAVTLGNLCGGFWELHLPVFKLEKKKTPEEKDEHDGISL